MDTALIIPSFIAGLLTFLAPCTLPLVPSYLAFISGVSLNQLKRPTAGRSARAKVFLNGLFYVFGFSAVFIILGSLFGLGGAVLIQYRVWLSRVGGLFVIFFGLFMLGLFKAGFLLKERRVSFVSRLEPGKPVSSFVFGAAFAFGWTPCIGPVLGSVLFLASSSATVLQGGFLLLVFSLGLAIPFLAIALGVQSAVKYIPRFEKFIKAVSVIGGIMLVIIGFFLLTDSFGIWLGQIYRFFDFLDYDRLLNYL